MELCAGPVVRMFPCSSRVASANCSDVIVTGGYYDGIYSSIDMLNDRHVFAAVDDEGNSVFLVFYYTSTERRLGAARGNLEGKRSGSVFWKQYRHEMKETIREAGSGISAWRPSAWW